MRTSAIVLVLFLAAAARGEELVGDFRGGKFDEKLFRFDGPDPQEFVSREDGGLRFTYPAGKKPRGTIGVAWRGFVHGDFKATALYEVIEIDRPTENVWGIGVELYLYLDTAPVESTVRGKTRISREGVSFTRLMRVQGGPAILYNHMVTAEDGQRVGRPRKEEPTATFAKRGRLRLAREGPTLIASYAEEDQAELTEFFRDQIGDVPVRMVRFGGIKPGATAARLDMRLIDFRLETGTPRPAAAVPAAAVPAADPDEPAPSGSLLVLAVSAAVLMLVLLLFFWLRKSRPAEVVDETATIAIDCECGQPLRIRRELTGKKVKCPACGVLVVVPASGSPK